MPSRALILAIAGDPGGAAALAPVLEHLHRENAVRVRALAYRQALKMWTQRSFVVEALPENLGDANLDALAGDAALLLAGTSALNGVDFEKRLTTLFRARGKPSVAVVDYWSNYGKRFADAEGRLTYVPDRVAAIDEICRCGLVADGIPGNRIVVTGHPAFDAIDELAQTYSGEQKRELRRVLGVAAHERLVLFASHPVSADRAGRMARQRQDAIDRLARSLDDIGNRTRQRIALLVRPHPKERHVAIPAPLRLRGTRVYWSDAGDPRHVALASDVVAGVDTMLLVEAQHMGCATFAMRDASDPAEGPYETLIPVCRSERDLVERLECLLADTHERRPPGGARPDAYGESPATANVTELVLKLLG